MSRKHKNDEIEMIELSTITGEKIRFFMFDVVEMNDHSYYLLQPEDLLENMEEDEVIVFEKIKEDENEHFDLVEDESIVERVIEKSNRSITDEYSA